MDPFEEPIVSHHNANDHRRSDKEEVFPFILYTSFN